MEVPPETVLSGIVHWERTSGVGIREYQTAVVGCGFGQEIQEKQEPEVVEIPVDVDLQKDGIGSDPKIRVRMEGE